MNRPWISPFTLRLLSLVFALSGLASCGKSKSRSLVLADVRLGVGVTAPEQVEIRVVQQGATAAKGTFQWSAASAGLLQAGVYVSGEVDGVVTVEGSGISGGLTIAATVAPATTTVKSGGTTEALLLTLEATHMGAGGAGGSAGAGGAGGGTAGAGGGGTGGGGTGGGGTGGGTAGTGGTAGAGGGAAGAGGIAGTGGNAGSGGTAGTGGAAGAGGNAGAGGGIDVPPTLTKCTEYNHIDTSEAQCLSSGIGDWAVRSVDFSPDGKLVATGGEDGRTVIWSVTPNGLVREGHVLSGSGQIYLRFAKSNAFLYMASRSGRLNAFSLPGFALVANAADNPNNPVINSTFYSVVVSSDGAHVVTIDADRTVRVFAAADLAQRTSFLLARVPYEIALAPAVGTSLWAGIGLSAREAVMVDILSATHPVTTIAVNTDDESVNAVAFSPNGNIFATGDGGGRVRFWDTTTRNAPTAIGAITNDPDTQDINGLAFFPGGQDLGVATGGFNKGGHARTLKMANRSWTAQFIPSYLVMSVAVSPDGKGLVGGEYSCGKILYCRD